MLFGEQIGDFRTRPDTKSPEPMVYSCCKFPIMDTKDEQEKEACQIFLAWYNRQHNRAYYLLGRAEDTYPELNGGKEGKWDFICCERDLNDWIAVEIKELVNREALIEVNLRIGRHEGRGKSIIERVEKECTGKITGIYWLNLPPLPQMRQSERGKLVGYLCSMLIKEASTLKAGGYINIGAQVEECLVQRSWPCDSFLPEIYLTKARDDASRLLLKSFAVWTGPVISYTQEVAKLVKKANRQLGQAKKRRASKAFLVFSCQFPSEEKQLREDVLQLPNGQSANIDRIYFRCRNRICFQI